MVDEATGLEVRSGGPLSSDPDTQVLIDWWLERGAQLGVWTDDEAERCRLAAFWPETALTFSDEASGRQWRHPAGYPSSEYTYGRIRSYENHASVYAVDDHPLAASVTKEWAAEMARGGRAPWWCFAVREGTYSEVREVLSWAELVKVAAARLALYRADALDHVKHKRTRRAAQAAAVT